MSNNPFDFGGALTGGFKGGYEVGEAIGRRTREGQVNRAGRKAFDIDRKLMELGVIDQDGNVAKGPKDDATMALLAKRDKFFSKIADHSSEMDQREWDGTKFATQALTRYNPLQGGDRARTGTEKVGDFFKGALGRKPAEAPLPPDGVGGGPILDTISTPPQASDAYEPARQNMNQLKRFSQSTGKTLASPEMDDAFRSKGVNYHGGMVMALLTPQLDAQRNKVASLTGPAADAARKEFLQMNDEQQDQLVSNVQNAIKYIPALKGSVVLQKAGQVYLDQSGGDAADAMPLNTLEAIDNLKNFMDTYSQGTSAILPNARAAEGAASEAQQKRVDKANELMAGFVKQYPDFLKGSGLDPAAFVAGTAKLDGAGWKVGNVADIQEGFDKFKKDPAAEAINVRTNADGQSIITAMIPGDETTDNKPRTQYYTADGQLLTDDQLAKMMGNDNANFMMQVLRGANQLQNENLASFFQAANGVATAVANNEVAQIDFKGRGSQEATGIPVPGATKAAIESIPYPETRNYVSKIIGKAGLPPANMSNREKAEYYIDALQEAESGGVKDPMSAESPKGALGPFQIMPDTATGPGFGMQPINLQTASYQQQKEFATTYLAKALDKFGGDPVKALAAYNAGPNSDWLAGLPSTGSGQLTAAVAAPPKQTAIPTPASAGSQSVLGKVGDVISGYGKIITDPFGTMLGTANQSTTPRAGVPASYADGGFVTLTPEVLEFLKGN